MKFNGATYRLLPVLFLWLVGCSIARHDNAAFSPTITQLTHSIASVACLRRTATGSLAATSIDGTAFFISSDGTFLSPAHVIADFEPRHALAACISGICIPKGTWTGGHQVIRQWFEFLPSQCVIDEQMDLAKCSTILHLRGTEFEPTTVIIDPTVHQAGTPVAFTGFPLGYIVPITSVGVIAAYLDSPNNNGPAFGRLIVDKPAWPGASGSPIYLEDGKLIGIIVATGAGVGAGTAYGLSSLTIDAFLKAHP